MKYTTVNIDGKEYPVSFGHSTLFEYERETGQNVFKMGSDGHELKHGDFITLCFLGLKNGHRKAKKPFSLTVFDLMDLLDNDPEGLERLTSAFEASQPAPVEKK